MTRDKLFCRFQKIGDCTSLLEVGDLTLCYMPCKAGTASAGPMLHILQWLTMASCSQLAWQSTSVAHAAQHWWRLGGPSLQK